MKHILQECFVFIVNDRIGSRYLQHYAQHFVKPLRIFVHRRNRVSVSEIADRSRDEGNVDPQWLANLPFCDMGEFVGERSNRRRIDGLLRPLSSARELKA